MTALVWFFVLTLNMPSFGGQVDVRVEARTGAGCEKFRTLVRKQMGQLMIRHEITACRRGPEAETKAVIP